MESLQVPLPHLENKCASDKTGAVIVIIFGFILITGGCLFAMTPEAFADDMRPYRYFIPLLFIVMPLAGFKLYSDAARDQQLYLKLKSKDLVLSEQSIEGPTAILEGPAKDELRRQSRASFSAPWSSVENFIIQPSLSQGPKKGSSPPLMKITFKNKKPDYDHALFILRFYLKGQEEKIVEFVRKVLSPDQIVLKDRLR